jgi:hypothetical protein
MESEDVDCIHVAQNTDKRLVLVNIMMDFWVS